MYFDFVALGVSLTIVWLIYSTYKLYEKIKILENVNTSLLKANHGLSETLKESSENFDNLSNAHEMLINDFEKEAIRAGILETQIENIKENNELILKEMKSKHKLDLKEARKNALDKSRAVIRGQATEHLAPYVMDGVNPKDCRFMGNPIDYVVFDGLSDVTDKVTKEVKEVIFVDVKTGKSNLTTVQRRIRDAIKDNRVSFQVVNPDKKEKKNGDKSIVSET